MLRDPHPIIFVLLCLTLAGCTTSTTQQNQEDSAPVPPAFIQALTLYASFDGEAADKAQGDAQLYSAASRDPQDTVVSGIGAASQVSLAPGAGYRGGALKFDAKTSNVVFFRCSENLAYSTSEWSGTVSFWLKLDPAVDLEPGFCDPIQITDVNYNDASLWVDFTGENPRDFRLGVIGDLNHWDPEGAGPTDNPEFDRRLVVVKQPPFSREAWTHIAIAYDQLNGSGTATLYVNGEAQGTIDPVTDPFTWDVSKANMYLGLNYIGLYDELSVYNRALSSDEIAALTGLEGSLKDLL
ncbi:MAG: LamG domain-containing protein [Bacteroidota bacterium]